MSNFLTVQAQRFKLAGAGITSSATTIVLQSFKTPAGTNILTADFGAIGYLTLDPGTSKEEVVSFTTVTQNSDGTATLTGIVRGLGFTTPYTTVSANQLSHAGGAIVVLSNPSAFYNKFPAKANDEVITGQWTVPAPLSGGDVVNKTYADALAMSGTGVTNAAVVVAGTAGETVIAGNLIYLKAADGYWWKTDADTLATVSGVMLGIAQGSGTAGNSVTGGVLIKGIDSNQSGLSVGSSYYASNTAGAITSSAGTNSKVIGVARTTTALYFDPYFAYSLTPKIVQTYTPSAAGTATLNLSLGDIHHITMPAGNITIAITGGTVGQCFIVRILQDGVGSRTVTWFSTIRWAGGSAPTLTTTLSKADTLGFEVTAVGSTYDGFIVGQNI